jgi:O-antigen ligase
MLAAPPKTTELLKALQLDENTLLLMANRFAFMERVAYWFTGFQTFNDHPWLGVGLGNSGFFALQNTPVLGWATYEIREVLFRSTSLPNTKSMWVRLLAETGLIGFAIFLSWLVGLWLSARTARGSQDATVRFMALIGQLALLAFLAEGFSIDSFAMPYLWVIAGLISASGLLTRKYVSEFLI